MAQWELVEKTVCPGIMETQAIPAAAEQAETVPVPEMVAPVLRVDPEDLAREVVTARTVPTEVTRQRLPRVSPPTILVHMFTRRGEALEAPAGMAARVALEGLAAAGVEAEMGLPVMTAYSDPVAEETVETEAAAVTAATAVMAATEAMVATAAQSTLPITAAMPR